MTEGTFGLHCFFTHAERRTVCVLRGLADKQGVRGFLGTSKRGLVVADIEQALREIGAARRRLGEEILRELLRSGAAGPLRFGSVAADWHDKDGASGPLEAA